jgi:hypothetical protein
MMEIFAAIMEVVAYVVVFGGLFVFLLACYFALNP